MDESKILYQNEDITVTDKKIIITGRTYDLAHITSVRMATANSASIYKHMVKRNRKLQINRETVENLIYQLNNKQSEPLLNKDLLQKELQIKLKELDLCTGEEEIILNIPERKRIKKAILKNMFLFLTGLAFVFLIGIFNNIYKIMSPDVLGMITVPVAIMMIFPVMYIKYKLTSYYLTGFYYVINLYIGIGEVIPVIISKDRTQIKQIYNMLNEIIKKKV